LGQRGLALPGIQGAEEKRSEVEVLPHVDTALTTWHWVGLAIALGGGALFRLWQINAVGFNSDEAVYAGQAAAIVGDPSLAPYFPLFRAHPLLYQFILSLGLTITGIEKLDLMSRVLTAAMAC